MAVRVLLVATVRMVSFRNYAVDGDEVAALHVDGIVAVAGVDVIILAGGKFHSLKINVVVAVAAVDSDGNKLVNYPANGSAPICGMVIVATKCIDDNSFNCGDGEVHDTDVDRDRDPTGGVDKDLPRRRRHRR